MAGETTHKCPSCGEQFPAANKAGKKTGHCPFCGAKVEGEQAGPGGNALAEAVVSAVNKALDERGIGKKKDEKNDGFGDW
jgi:hypothetical protein